MVLTRIFNGSLEKYQNGMEFYNAQALWVMCVVYV